jgi:hypothetical protein
MSYSYKHFNKKGFTDFGFGSRIELIFALECYFLMNAHSQHRKIVKNYTQQISDEEISAFMKIEAERHFKAIENKINSNQEN